MEDKIDDNQKDLNREIKDIKGTLKEIKELMKSKEDGKKY